MKKLRPNKEKLMNGFIKAIKKEEKGIDTGLFKKTVYPRPATPTEAKKVRSGAHLSQDEFAELLGVSTVTVRAWEHGRRRPDGPATKLMRLIEKRKLQASVLASI